MHTSRQIRYTPTVPPIQIAFLTFTFTGPLMLWILSRHLASVRFSKGICWFFALAMLSAKIGTTIAVWREGNLTADYALPMHLCDWALIATVLALTLRWQVCFELAYFWGLAGTAQALITPALDSPDFWRIFAFFTVHAGIPASVLWLIFDFKLRPLRGAWLRVALWSQLYIAAALAVNALTHGNYGFLSGRPVHVVNGHVEEIRSMLDIFTDPIGWKRWLYVLEIDLTGLLFCFLLGLPWQIARWKHSRSTAAER